MNKIYKVIWNKSSQTWVAVSEIASACGKGSVRSQTDGHTTVCENQGAGSFLLSTLAATIVMMMGSVVLTPAQAAATCVDPNNPTTTVGTASGTNAVACGDGTTASGTSATAISSNANATTIGDVAIGASAVATGRSTATSISASSARGETLGSATAVGTLATATGRNAIAIGNNAQALGTVDGGGINDVIAIGANSSASANRGTALGYRANVATGAINSIAIGTQANNYSTGAIAIGNNATVGSTTNNNISGISIGNSAGANYRSGTENVSIGNQSGQYINGNTNYSLGSRAGFIINGADNYSQGIEAGQMVTGSQNSAIGYATGRYVNGSNNQSFGVGVRGTTANNLVGQNVNGNDNISLGTRSGRNIGEMTATVTNNQVTFTSTTKSNRNTALGYESNNFSINDPLTTSDNLAIGTRTTASGGSAVALGAGAQATGANSIALGTANVTNSGTGNDQIGTVSDNTVASGASAIAIGNGAQATGDQTISIGTGNVVSGDNSGAFGDPNTVSGTGSYAFGNDNTISGDNTFVLGNDVEATADNNVILGNASSESSATTTDGAPTQVNSATVNDLTYGDFAGTATGVVSVGATGAERQIINVAPGEISATSTDAINGSQLYATQDVIGNVASSAVSVLGGDAAVDPTGTITMSNIGGTGEDTVHDAIAKNAGDIATNATNIQTNADNITQNTNDIATNAGNIATNTTNIATNTAEIAKGLDFAGDTGTFNRKLGDTVNVKGGNTGTLTDGNIGVEANGTDTLTVKLAENVDLGANGSLTTGNTVVNNDGVTITGGTSPVSLTASGLDNGGNVISNVGQGVAGTDAVNVDQLNDAIANVDGYEGWSLSANGGTAEKIDGGETVDLSNTDGNITLTQTGNNIEFDLADSISVGTANPVTIDGDAGTIGGLTNTTFDPANIVSGQAATEDQLASVAGDVADNATNIQANADNIAKGINIGDGDTATQYALGDTINITEADSNIVTTTTTDGVSVGLADAITVTSVTAGNTVVNNDGLTIANGPSVTTTGINAGDKKITGVATGTDDTDAVNVAQLNDVADTAKAAKTEVEAGDNIEVTSTTGADGQTVYTVATADDVSFDSVTTGTGANQTVINNDGVKVGNNVLNGDTITVNGATVTSVNDAINQTAEQAFNPLTFAGDTGANVERQLGQTVNIQGGNTSTLTDGNIGVVADGTDTLTVKLAENVDLGTNGSLTTGNTVVNNDGVTITGGTSPVSLTATGLDNGGNVISNVGQGVAGTDAVNVDQLNDAIANVDGYEGWNLSANGGSAEKIDGGETVDLSNTDGNITLTQTGSKVVFGLANNITVGTDNPVTINGTTGTIGGLTNTAFDPANIVSGQAATEDQLASVAGDVADNATNIATNAGNIATNTTNIAANTAEIAKGLTFAGDTGANVNRKLGDTVNVKGGNTGALTDNNIGVEADGTDTLTVKLAKDIDLGTNGSLTTGNTKVDNGGLTIESPTATNPNNTVSLTNTGLNNGGNVITNVASGGIVDSNAATIGDVKAAATKVTSNNKTVTINSNTTGNATTYDLSVDAQSVANTAQLPVVYTDTSGNKVYKQADGTFNTAIDGTGSAVAPTGIMTALQNADGTTTTATKLGNVATGTLSATSTDAVNGSQLFATNQNVTTNTTNIAANTAEIAKGINFGDGATANNYALGDTINVKGDANVISTTTADGVQLKLADNLNVTSVTTGNTKMDSTGVTITGGANPVSLTATGLNNGGNKITGVAAGTADTDAVNVAQLNNVADTAKAAKTEVVKGDNIEVTSSTGANGQTVYTVATAKDVSFDKVTVGNVAIDSTTNNITGLANTTLGATTFGQNGRAATEAQLNTAQTNLTNILGGNAANANGNVTMSDIGGTGANNIHDAIAAVRTTAAQAKNTVTAGDNVVVASNTNADGSTNYTVSTAKDLTVDSVKAGNTTVDGDGLTITGGPSVTTTGINAGNKTITGVAAGVNDTDAVNVKQLNDGLASVNTNITNVTNNVTNINNTIGDSTLVNPDGTLTDEGKTALTTYNVQGQTEYVNNSVISAIQNINEQGIKFFHTNDGQTFTAQDTNSVDSSASGQYSTAIGYKASATAGSGLAIGNTAVSSGENAIAIGAGAKATGANSISIGTGNTVSGDRSGAFGDPTTITGNDSYSVGNDNTIGTDKTFVLGNNVTQTLDNSVILGDSSSATAVNTGSYTYEGANDTNVAGVSDAVGVVSVGTTGQTRQVQNVAAGVVSADSTDAINGSQLYYTNQAIKDVGDTVINMQNHLNGRINDVEDDANAGVSSAMAMAALPQAYLPGKSMLTGGMATYNGEGAVAVGFSKLSDNGRWVLKISGSADTQGNAGGAVGAGFHF